MTAALYQNRADDRSRSLGRDELCGRPQYSHAAALESVKDRNDLGDRHLWLDGIEHDYPQKALAGALAAVVLAVIADQGLRVLERRMAH